MMKRISLYAAVIATGGLMYLPVIAEAKEGGARGAFFERVDADKDGQITQAEMAAHGAERFARIDADDDGFVTQAEIEAMQSDRAKRRAARMIDRLDGDGDGQISLTELQSKDRGQRLFERADADGDGMISKAEFDAVKDRRHGQRKP